MKIISLHDHVSRGQIHAVPLIAGTHRHQGCGQNVLLALTRRAASGILAGHESGQRSQVAQVESTRLIRGPFGRRGPGVTIKHVPP